MRRSPFVGAFIIAASISILVVVLQHRHSSLRCALDGTRIEPLYEVTISHKDQLLHKFSCILSARIWLNENGEPASSVWVTDELTGEKIKAEDAFFVESEVVTTPHTGNKIHVFALKTEAESHARTHKGTLVKNPLRFQRKKPIRMVTYRPDPKKGPEFVFPVRYK